MMGRPPCCDGNSGVKKGPWTAEEDKKLFDYVSKNGHGSWRALPALAGLNRCGKSCRLRWTNYLRPDIKRGDFSVEEERRIIELHSFLGNKWSAIATRLPRRTDNEIKNYWNTHIRKKLLREGIDPVTHQPRPDLRLLTSLPNLLASAPTSLDGSALRLPADALQMARTQLFQTLLQVLACGGNYGAADSWSSTDHFLSNLVGPGHGFAGPSPTSRPPFDPIQTTDQTQDSRHPFGTQELDAFLNSNTSCPSNSCMFPHVLNFQNSNAQISHSMPSLVPSSPENLLAAQVKEPQNLNNTSNNNMVTAASTVCESLDLDDLSGDELYWKELFDHASSPAWPFCP